MKTFDVQRGKRVLMPYATREGPDERACPCSLIWTLSVRWLQYPLILWAGNEGPDQPAQSGRLIRAFIVCKCLMALFVRCASYALCSSWSYFSEYPEHILSWINNKNVDVLVEGKKIILSRTVSRFDVLFIQNILAFYFSRNTYVVGTHKINFGSKILMWTKNIISSKLALNP